MRYRSLGNLVLNCTLIGELSVGAVVIACAGGVEAEVIADHWTIETVAVAQPDAVDMEIGPDGLISMVFHNDIDGTNFYMKRDASGNYTNLGFPYSGYALQLDFDPVDGKPYILYVDHDSFDLMLASQDAQGNWSTEQAVSTDTVRALDFEMLNGRAYFAFTRTSGETRYGYYDIGVGGYSSGFIGPSGADDTGVSLALRSDGVPRMSYAADGFLNYGKFTNSLFQGRTSETVDGDDPAVGLYNDLVLDSGDNPSIAYYDQTNADLRYAWYNSFTSTWALSTLDGDPGIAGDLTSMVLDPRSDFPRIAYRALDCGVCLIELVSGGNWVKTEVSDVSPSYERKILTDAQGNLFILFSDGDSGTVRLAVDHRGVFSDGFETGSTDGWDQTEP